MEWASLHFKTSICFAFLLVTHFWQKRFYQKTVLLSKTHLHYGGNSWKWMAFSASALSQNLRSKYILRFVSKQLGTTEALSMFAVTWDVSIFLHYWGHFGNGKRPICFQTCCAAVLTEVGWWPGLGPPSPPPQLAQSFSFTSVFK